MSSWINDAADRARREDEDRQSREQAYEREVPRFWGDLQRQVEQDVSEMNKNEELRQRRIGSQPLEFQRGDRMFAVSKVVFPAAYLRVNNEGRTISVERETVTWEQRRNDQGGKKVRETLTFEVDADYNLHLKTKDGDSLSVGEASRHLLTPILNANR